ncbi:conserved repeat domain containing protein, putative [Trypanosoma equiperdum]|uniref:Translocon-associated protein subunit beta n=4 Tax=Trypanozoon TaxID=39700 RepID=Q587B6_TRYB2|nr:hypothetical protein, conserved [Trypanosoma brucei gambiense DAL972]XP_845567.1 hypothetical protein, conserved [Trypanosoma brucei brucei TREU927]AAX79261.1 hypothetical protein, conserved [Trypanosoma brucei]RHW72059.1 conserved repeat domain containing protein [Trypanosoma brucei equiperdum]SCU64261.1 conserved repeat domain containing protein, putative [Trypanosoma equiperdum]AAZ12008.1 hypothetical protein, conserved [Trypanosoma brucei brucei TREU927]CBH11950.1 hypothetical protein,|eukprot:XP_011774235.1 hypothetical protein, conserved [Trypanosoma brucei gambiense DAL972]
MRLLYVIPLLLAAAAVGSLAQPDPQPLLFVSKMISDDHVVVGNNVEFTVTVYNYGQSPAFDITITDLLPDGTTRTKQVDSLAFGESAELKYTIVTKALGGYHVGVTEVLYSLERGGKKTEKAYSNIIREGTAYFYGEDYDDTNFRGIVSVVTREFYDRLYKSYVREAAVYAFLCLVPALFPLVVYRMEQSQVDLLIRRSKAVK